MQCRLWQIDEPEVGRDDMDIVETLAEDSHFIRRVLRCRGCGQLYFYEFYEEIDWLNGNDPQYRTYVPVDEGDIAALREMGRIRLLTYEPRLQRDWPRDAERPITKWIR